MTKSIWSGLKRLAKRLEKSVFFITLASLFWLLWRSGTKPSRITYPCQKAAAFQVSSAVYLIPLLYFHRLRHLFARKLSFRQVCKYSLVTVVIFSFVALSSTVYDQWVFNQQWAEYKANAARGPVGKVITAASGAVVYATIPSAMAQPSPHRVVSVHSSDATTWQGSGHPYDRMNQEEIDEMVNRGVMTLTGESTLEDAWSALIPYQSGEAVAIKLNFNNLWNCNNFGSNPQMNAYPALANSVIDGLKAIGIPSDKIWLVDPSRPINDAFRNRILDPDVQYYTKCTEAEIGDRPNVFHTDYAEDGSPYSTQGDRGNGQLAWIDPAMVFVDADHIINIPQLKGHGGASITLGLKNNFGSVLYSRFTHAFFYVNDPQYNPDTSILADINNNPIYKDKTRLIIGDGLMGHPTTNTANPVLWESFGDSPPEILFFGVDPVAADSVMFDYLQRECEARGSSARIDDILHYAASIGLGVHEHWNNNDDREYNMIDYIEIDLDLEENCSNGVQDGDEEGVDCGGSCPNPCSAECTNSSDCDDTNVCTGDVCDSGSCRYINYNLDGSDTIGLGDIIQVIGYWGLNEGEPGWNPEADLDENGNVGLGDIIVLIGVWGEFC